MTRRQALLLGVPTIAVLVAGFLWLTSGRFVSTENAYLKASIVQIAPEIAGRVAEVLVKDHGTVAAGEVLFKLDPEPYRLALAKAEAELDQSRAQVENFRTAWAEAMMELKEAESKVTYFDQQFTRQKQLSARGVIGSAKLEEAESNLIAARDRVDVIQKKIARTLTSLRNDPNLPPERHGLVREKKAARDRAARDLELTTIVAPVGGIVVSVKLQPGEQVKAATPLFAIVANTRPWIEANFKETDLTHVRVGQRAQVVLDIYPDLVWDAEVESISPATGAEFSILPPQNATGNWIKVVQRLPVKLRLIAQSSEPPLRTGMTATVWIDTERQSRLAGLLFNRVTAADRASNGARR